MDISPLYKQILSAPFASTIMPLASSTDGKIKKCIGSFIGDNQRFTALKVHRDVNCLLRSLSFLYNGRAVAQEGGGGRVYV